MYIMAPKPLSTACFINLSHQFVCVYVYLTIAARQRLCKKNVTAATNTHTKMKEFLDVPFSVRFIRIEIKYMIGSSQKILSYKCCFYNIFGSYEIITW
jgi:hypothetical protein